MNMRIRSFSFFILFILIISIYAHMGVKEKPLLYGTVKLRTSSGDILFTNAKIELLDVKSEEDNVLYKTYTDSYGNFAFYRIQAREYHLRVLKGGKVLDQLEGNERIKRRLVKVTDKSTRLPDIIVIP